MSSSDKAVSESKGPKLLTDGMYDHGCLIQRPRYFRHCLFYMCLFCALFAIPIFFSAMSTIIVQKEELPLWSRYSEKYNTPTPDAAIFTNDIDGSIYVRLCRGDGRVPFFCSSCSSSSSSDYYDDLDSKTDPTSKNAPASGKFANNTTTATSIWSSVSRRRSTSSTAHQVQDHSNCSCGAVLAWADDDKCPKTVLSEVFSNADVNTNCKNFINAIETVHVFNFVYIVVGMAWFFVAGLFLICCIGPFMGKHCKLRFLTPFLGQIFCIVFGIGVPSLMFASNLIIAVNANSILTEQDGKGHYTDANYCGESSSEGKLYLYDEDFRDNNMFRLWQTAVAGAVFTAIPPVFCFFALCYMCVYPSPDRKNFDSDFNYENCHYQSEYRERTKLCDICCFPDYEETAPNY